MTEHKFADVLRAIADGVPLSEFEYEVPDEGSDAQGDLSEISWHTWVNRPELWTIRRKPQYIMVNGFKVPKPLDVAPGCGCKYFVASVTVDDFFIDIIWNNDQTDTEWLSRGLCHATKEAAIIHAKAMLGIDPNTEETK